MLGTRRQGKRGSGRIGVAFGRDGLAAVRLAAGGRDRPPRLVDCTRLAGTDPRSLAAELERWADEHGGRRPVNAVLAPGE